MVESDIASWPGWKTVRLIGRGSFGAVYEIERKIFDETEKAALKVISIPQNSGDIEDMYSDGYDEESITNTFKSHLQSIVAEYSLMRKMNGCANIINCDDVRYVQHDDGIGWDVFIKMELLAPLTKTLPANISEETVVKIAKDMCCALDVCKKHGIIHRDIKPQNIFVSEYGDYKLGDFGIAKTVEKTMGGTKIGTYKYMAPEVYNNQPYGAAADIYSLGLVLYWLLNERRMPFMPLPPEKMKAGAEENSRHRRLSGEKLPAPAHGSDELKRIVLNACAYDPKDRYTSAAAMLDDLRKLSGEAVVVSSVVTPQEKSDEKIEDNKTTGISFSEEKTVKSDYLTADDSDATVAPCFAQQSATVSEKQNVEIPSAGGNVIGNRKNTKVFRSVVTVLLMAATYVLSLEALIERIIIGNIILIEHEYLVEPLTAINGVLRSLIGASNSEPFVFFINRFGVRYVQNYAFSFNLIKDVCFWILPPILLLVLPVVDAVLHAVYKKQKLLVISGWRRVVFLSIVVALYMMMADIFIRRAIVGGIMLAHECEILQGALTAFNNFLAMLIGGTIRDRVISVQPLIMGVTLESINPVVGSYLWLSSLFVLVFPWVLLVKSILQKLAQNRKKV